MRTHLHGVHWGRALHGDGGRHAFLLLKAPVSLDWLVAWAEPNEQRWLAIAPLVEFRAASKIKRKV